MRGPLNHTITADIEVKADGLSSQGGDPLVSAYPTIEIQFSVSSGSPDYWNKAGGHWEQGWSAEVEFSSATLVDGDGLDLTQARVDELAAKWLADHPDEAFEAAGCNDGPDPDDARERLRERAHMGEW